MVDYSIFTRENFELLQCINYKKVVIDNLKFTIYGVRYNENQGCSCSPHIHEYTEFHYIYSGEVETTVNGVVRICGPKQFYLMTPLSIHSHRTLPERNNGYYSFAIRWLVERTNSDTFNADLNRIRLQLLNAPASIIDDSDEEIAAYMYQIIMMAKSQRSATELMLRTIELITRLSEAYSILGQSSSQVDELPGKTQNILQSAITYIDMHHNESISARDVAENTFISYSHLARIFSKYMHKSINAYILQVRLDRAMQLLMTTDLSISEISQMTGFMSISYFSNTFKRHFGQTPTDFRAYYKQLYFRGDPSIM